MYTQLRFLLPGYYVEKADDLSIRLGAFYSVHRNWRVRVSYLDTGKSLLREDYLQIKIRWVGTLYFKEHGDFVEGHCHTFVDDDYRAILTPVDLNAFTLSCVLNLDRIASDKKLCDQMWAYVQLGEMHVYSVPVDDAYTSFPGLSAWVNQRGSVL